jgi:hypothetical protein
LSQSLRFTLAAVALLAVAVCALFWRNSTGDAGAPVPIESVTPNSASVDDVEAVARAETSVAANAAPVDIEEPPSSPSAAGSRAPMREFVIVGRVVDSERQPVEGVSVMFDWLTDADQAFRTDKSGAFELRQQRRLSRRPEDFPLRLSARTHAARRVDLSELDPRPTVLESESTTRIDVGDLEVAAGATIRGRVVHPDETPIAGARVVRDDLTVPYSMLAELRRNDGRMLGIPRPDAQSATDGSFELEGLPTGRVRLVASARGSLATFSEIVELRAGEVRTGIELALEPLEREDYVRGVVLSPDGSPIVRAVVIWASPSDPRVRQRADERGEFVFELRKREAGTLIALDERERELFAHLDSVQPGASVELRTAPMREVPVSVRSSEGDAIPQARVQVHTAGPAAYSFPGFREVTGVRMPPMSIVVSGSAPGFGAARVGPFDGALVERVDIVLERKAAPEAQPVASDDATDEELEEEAPEEPAVARLEVDFHGEISVDGAPPKGVWTMELGILPSADEWDPTDRVTLDEHGRFVWRSPAIGEQRLRAIVVGGLLDGVILFDKCRVSSTSTSYHREFETARVRIDGNPTGSELLLVWHDASSAIAAIPLRTGDEFVLFEGEIKLVARDDATLDTPASSWPALASGRASHDDLLVLRAP